MSGKIKKYVVPNLPYLLAFWFFCKVGTAYRLAAGADFGAKLVGMLKTMGPAFESFAPGRAGFDLLVGLAGVDLGEHQKKTIPLVWLLSLIMLVVGVLTGGITI